MITKPARQLTQVAEPDNDEPLSFREVARIIAKGRPPAWLVTNLRLCANGVGQSRIADEAWEPLTKTRSRLEAISRAAELIVRELHDVTILSYLETDRSSLELTPIIHVLGDLAKRGRSEAGALKVKPGANKPGPRADGLDARAICALVVIETWFILHGIRPNPKSTELHQAADAFWRSSGGPVLSKSKEETETTLTNWERTFKKLDHVSVEYRALVRGIIQRR